MAEFELRPIPTPKSPSEIMQGMNKEGDALMEDENIDPVAFAIEAMRLNITYAAYKNEVILHEAMRRLQSVQEQKKIKKQKRQKRLGRIQEKFRQG